MEILETILAQEPVVLLLGAICIILFVLLIMKSVGSSEKESDHHSMVQRLNREKSESEQEKKRLIDMDSAEVSKLKNANLQLEEENRQLKNANLEYQKLADEKESECKELFAEHKEQVEAYEEKVKELSRSVRELKKQLKPRLGLLQSQGSNLTAIPYMSRIIADFETFELEYLARCLDWGHDQKRLKKARDIRELRAETKQFLEQYKEAEYQLAYLLELYPALQDVIESDYSEMPKVQIDALKESDPVKDYLSSDEYNNLSSIEKNQLALDRYIESHKKTKWQIGRDYELYVGYQYLKKGCKVDYFGSNMGLEDLGRDLIVTKPDGSVLIVQCKYWSEKKLIHEKHITQLYGTMVSYCIENNIMAEFVKGVLVTNISLSPMAKKMASYLDIRYKENYEMGDFPRIKCNNGKDEYGYPNKIYHLPMDQQYDNVKMIHKDDFFAMTVEEAEKAGYRRANKWFGN